MPRGLAFGLFFMVAIGCTTHTVSPTDEPTDIATTRSPPVTPTVRQSTPSPTQPSTESPTSTADPVLQLTVYEFPSPATLKEPSEFSLYEDGRVVYLLKQSSGGFELRQAQLDPRSCDELIADTVAVLGEAQATYDDIDDGLEPSTTVFDVRTPELEKTVSVEGLGELDEQAPSASDRAMLAPLRERLVSFDAEVQAGGATDLGIYEPESYLVELHDSADELPDKIDWPWPTLEPADFAETDVRTRSRLMTPSELANVLPVAGDDYLIATAPNGDRYVIQITPLLPGENSVQQTPG